MKGAVAVVAPGTPPQVAEDSSCARRAARPVDASLNAARRKLLRRLDKEIEELDRKLAQAIMWCPTDRLQTFFFNCIFLEQS